MYKMKFSMNGYGENAASFKTDGIVCSTHPVKITDNFTVSPCADGDAFAGIADGVRGNIACIQLAGYAEVTYSGAAPAFGWCSLAADGKGGVKVSENGKEYLVTRIDAENNKVGIII